MPIDASLFRSALSRFATGVTIVTAHDDDGRHHGMTVSAFSSLSLEPPLVLVAIGHEATMAPVMATAGSFAVNVLAEEHEELSRRFSGPLDDRFAGVAHTTGPLGDAVLDGVLAWLQCRVVARHPAGDHTIHVGEVEAAQVGNGSPLLYFRGGYAGLAR